MELHIKKNKEITENRNHWGMHTEKLILEIGEIAKFKLGNDIIKRKVLSIYTNPFSGDVKYNTKGFNGGYSCNGYSFENKDIIK